MSHGHCGPHLLTTGLMHPDDLAPSEDPAPSQNLAPSQKSAIRAAALAARGAVSPDAATAFAKRLTLLGPSLARDHAARVVSAYWPIGDEAVTLPMLDALDAAGFAVALPVTGRIGEALVFRHWRRGDAMELGRMAIRVPSAAAPVLVPDMLFVPLAAFDRSGHRVGYGAGFYDRSLAALRAQKRVVAVGVAYASQEVPAVPHEAHDEALDMIVTDRDVIACAAGRR